MENFFSEGPEEEDQHDEVSKWKNFRVRALMAAEAILGQELDQWEKEMFLFPKVCRGCLRAKAAKELRDCHLCGCAAFCTDENCGGRARQAHARHCRELKYAMACDNFECTVSVAAPALPLEVDAVYRPLPKDMDAYLSQHLGDDRAAGSNDDGLTLMERKFLSDRVSGPLTILHAMQKFGLAGGALVKDKCELTVHVVGANITEMLGIYMQL